MPQVFYPIIEETVPASSPPHPPNTEYRIAIGKEDWTTLEPVVLKIQMVYNGAVNGRRSPSYPVGSDDEQRVRAAVDRVTQRYRAMIRSQLGESASE